MTATVLPFARGNLRVGDSWTDAFIDYSRGAQSNDLFRRWSAIGIIAGALERKVWILSQGSKVYPNFYIFLVAPPGVGKTRQLLMARELYQPLVDDHIGTEGHKLARVSLTKAALMDQLHASVRVAPPLDSFNSMLITSLELGALIPNYDPDFLSALTYLYDCVRYDEQRRGTKNEPLIIDNPSVTMVACTTPNYLVTTMPPSAWEGGFLARCILIYSGTTEVLDLKLNQERSHDKADLERDLKEDLKDIGNRVGKMAFTPAAGERIRHWNMSEGDHTRTGTAPTHPRLQHYNTRRPIHLLKLCMVAAADRGAPDIDLPDVDRALEWLTEAEGSMSNVFTAMASGGISSVIYDCWHYAKSRAAATENQREAYRIYHFLQGRLPPHEIRVAIEMMIKGNMLEHCMVRGIIAGFKVGDSVVSL
jgi:hypothetical protein